MWKRESLLPNTVSTLQASDATNERRSARKLDRSHYKRQARAIVALHCEFVTYTVLLIITRAI